jgi:hypothetical protein
LHTWRAEKFATLDRFELVSEPMVTTLVPIVWVTIAGGETAALAPRERTSKRAGQQKCAADLANFFSRCGKRFMHAICTSKETGFSPKE